MAIQEIPWRFEGERSRINYEITLDNVQYLFRFVYQDRSASWYLSIRLIDNTLLAPAIRLVPDWPLSLGWVDERLPSGTFWVVRKDDLSRTPNFDDVAEGKCALLRITGDDLVGGSIPTGIEIAKVVAV
jgi:Domain of unknown function (DUF6983)